MLNDKELKNYKRRIIKAYNTFSVCGDMLLSMEFQHRLTFEQLKQLRDYLILQNVSPSKDLLGQLRLKENI